MTQLCRMSYCSQRVYIVQSSSWHLSTDAFNCIVKFCVISCQSWRAQSIFILQISLSSWYCTVVCVSVSSVVLSFIAVSIWMIYLCSVSTCCKSQSSLLHPVLFESKWSEWFTLHTQLETDRNSVSVAVSAPKLT